MRVFFGHPKAWDDELIDEAVKEIAGSMSTELGHPVEVVAGRDDFHRNIASEGNFNGWCRSITRRTDERGARWYSFIVVPKTDGIGKATMMIVEDALKARLPVGEVEFVDDGSISVKPVVRVECRDSDDFISGWELLTTDT